MRCPFPRVAVPWFILMGVAACSPSDSDTAAVTGTDTATVTTTGTGTATGSAVSDCDRNHPNRNSDTAVNFGGGDWGTIANIVPTIQGMINAANADRRYGPFVLYVSSTQYNQAALTYYTDGSGQTPLDRILAMPQIEAVKQLDINILPDRLLFNPLKLLAHRSVEEVVELIAMGERVTWPKVEMIRIQTRIGRKLDRIVGQLDHGATKVSGSTVRRAV